ncbi:MAG: hypothetical protein KKD92_12050 [Proteobacteria bacterium]|nr:hypothetical protein [Pseudomonadota bacterium]
MNRVECWTNNRKDFQRYCLDLSGEWIITRNNQLIKVEKDMEIPEGDTRKESFIVAGCNIINTTELLRSFCAEHHPEIDFDTEFETNKPGVFARYEEKFSDDYEEVVREQQYEALKKELSTRGYGLPWEN